MALQKRVAKKYPFKDYSQNGTLSGEEAKNAAIDAVVRDQVTEFLGVWTTYGITLEEVVLYVYVDSKE